MDISEVPGSHLLCHVMMLMSHSLQRGQPPAFISKPAIIGYSPIFRIFFTPPPPPPTLQLLGMQSFPKLCLTSLLKFVLKPVRPYDEGCQGDVVLNEIPFQKRQLCSPR